LTAARGWARRVPEGTRRLAPFCGPAFGGKARHRSKPARKLSDRRNRQYDNCVEPRTIRRHHGRDRSSAPRDRSLLGGLDEHDLGRRRKKWLGEPGLTTNLLLTDAGHPPLVDPLGPTLGELPRGSARNSKGLADLLVRLSLVAQADRRSHVRYRIAAWFVSHGSGFLRFKASILAWSLL